MCDHGSMTGTLIDHSSPTSPVRWAGIAELVKSESGVRPMRLPAWALAQSDAIPLPVVASMPSGARIEFETDATSMSIECQLITTRMGDRPITPVVFEATVDNAVVASHRATHFHVIHTPDPTRPDITVIPGSAENVVLDGLPVGAKFLRVWLPQNAGVEIRGISVNVGASVGPPPPDSRRRWIHYGSSISHCMEAEHPLGVWPVMAANRADVNLTNLGLGGQCHLDQFVARIMRDSGADLLSMKVGINVVNLDSMRDRIFTPALHGFIDTVRDGNPDTPFIIMSPIHCPGHETGFGPSLRALDGVYSRERPAFLETGALTLVRIRDLVANVVRQRRDAGDTNIHYVDGLNLFGPDDVGDMPDKLHPNGAGYARMGERFHSIAFANGPFGEDSSKHVQI